MLKKPPPSRAIWYPVWPPPLNHVSRTPAEEPGLIENPRPPTVETGVDEGGGVRDGPAGVGEGEPTAIRPMVFPSAEVYQTALSGPPAMADGSGPGVAYSVSTPTVVIRPIFWPCCSVNHIAPSGAFAMLVG